MFRRTHIRLTLINSLVFIILIGALGFVIYSYTDKRLYKDVDRVILETARRLESINPADHPNQAERSNQLGHMDRGPKGFGFSRMDPRIDIIKWNEQNQPEYSTPNSFLFEQNEAAIQPKVFNELYDVKVEKYFFRTYAVKVQTESGVVTYQVLRNVNSEQELLKHLLIIMVVGCGIGIICAVAAGYFLAGRALVPIQKAWQKQQQFVSDASHELRTPLTVIQSKADVLFRSPTSTVQEKAIDISIIANECRRLAKLVANLLTLARSDSNELEMEKKEFFLDQLLHELVEHYEEIAAYQEKTLQLQTSSDIHFIGDKERMHQLLVILLDNAMKYTEAGGEILLQCQQTASSITIRVQDNGIGIAEEEIPKIFDRFYQSDKARTMSEGAGLGLSIAKWIIEKHHGKVKVYSTIGEGTSFEIVFPKHQRV